MKPAGQAEIDRAKADGRWDAAYRVKEPALAELQAASTLPGGGGASPR